MKIGKLNKIVNLSGTIANQAITLEEVIAKTMEISVQSLGKNPNLLVDQVQGYTSEEIKGLSEQLISQIKSVSRYNQISDQRIYIGSSNGSNGFKAEQAEALRQRNRTRIEESDKVLKDLNSKLREQLKDIDYYIDYDEDDVNQVAIMNFLFSKDHIPGKVSFEQILRIRSLISRISSIEGQGRLNRYKKKTNEKQVVLDNEYSEEIDLTYKYLFSKLETLTGLSPFFVEVVVRQESFGAFGFEDDFFFSLKKSIREYKILGLKGIKGLGIRIGPSNKAKTIKTFDLYADLIAIETEIKDNEVTIKPTNINEKIGLMPLEEETRNLQATVDHLKNIVKAIDEKKKINEDTLVGKEPIKISGPKGKSKNLSLDEIGDCFDCFKGKWDLTGDLGKDFKFNIGLENDISSLLDRIDFNIGEIKTASNLPYSVQQNYCSLMRMGSLCPIEIATIIASLTAMIIFTWQELMNVRFDFFADLAINLVLNPILNGLKLGINFSFSPMGDYADCVLATIDKLMNIDKTSGQYGVPADSIFVALFGSSSNPETQQKSITDQLLEQSKITDENKEKARAGLLEGLNPSSTDKYTALASNPLMELGIIDAMELPKAIVSDAIGKLNGISNTINLFIQNIENMLGSIMASRIDTAKKVLGFTALIPLLSGLWELANKGIEPCIPMPLSDGSDPGERRKTLESPFNIAELAQMAQIENIKYDDKITSLDPITSANPGLTNGTQAAAGAYLYNPITDTRFNLTNCDKAKSSIISKGESLEFWKRIALGADIDNV
jgi:hypothetical protein